MKSHYIPKLSLLFIVFLCTSLSNCDPNDHSASDHPCNFPDVETEIDLRSPWTYKIIDKKTSKNLVDTTDDALIHRDSVILFDENFEAIPPSYEYYLDNWTFDNFLPYYDLPLLFDDPDAYLNLEQRTFYLRTAYNDLDTIDIFFEQCLVKEVLFNGVDTHQPMNHPYDGGTSLYFKK